MMELTGRNAATARWWFLRAEPCPVTDGDEEGMSWWTSLWWGLARPA